MIGDRREEDEEEADDEERKEDFVHGEGKDLFGDRIENERWMADVEPATNQPSNKPIQLLSAPIIEQTQNYWNSGRIPMGIDGNYYNKNWLANNQKW